MAGKEKRDVILKRMEWRRILPELKIPLQRSEEAEEVQFLENGKPVPFEHPEPSEEITPRSDDSYSKPPPQLPNLWPFKYVSRFKINRKLFN